jgi:hypothetical protein
VAHPKDPLEPLPARTWLRGLSPLQVEGHLRTLEKRYRAALSGAVVAKSRYLALADERSATSPAIERAYLTWQQLEARRRVLAVRMENIEGTERTVNAGPRRLRVQECSRSVRSPQLALEV